MRALWGGLLVVAGIASVVWWVSGVYSERTEASIAASVDDIAQSVVREIEAEVTGRDITITGIFDTEDEKASILTAMKAIDGVREISDQTTVLPLASPFVTTVKRTLQAPPRVSGAIPEARIRADLAELGVTGMEDLVVSAGAPDQWREAFLGGLRGLRDLREGEFTLRDTRLIYSGEVRNPEAIERIIDNIGVLPDSFTVDTDGLAPLDDGSDAAFTLTFETDGPASLLGKLPEGVSADDLARALGRDQVDNLAKTGLTGSGDGPAALLATEALALLISGTLDMAGKTITMSGIVRDRSVLADVAERIGPLPDIYTFDMSAIELLNEG